MKPSFLNTENGSGKKISSILEKVFKILDKSVIYAEYDYIDYRMFEREDFDELKMLLENIDQEIQEGSEWITD